MWLLSGCYLANYRIAIYGVFGWTATVWQTATVQGTATVHIIPFFGYLVIYTFFHNNGCWLLCYANVHVIWLGFRDCYISWFVIPAPTEG